MEERETNRFEYQPGPVDPEIFSRRMELPAIKGMETVDHKRESRHNPLETVEDLNDLEVGDLVVIVKKDSDDPASELDNYARVLEIDRDVDRVSLWSMITDPEKLKRTVTQLYEDIAENDRLPKEEQRSTQEISDSYFSTTIDIEPGRAFKDNLDMDMSLEEAQRLPEVTSPQEPFHENSDRLKFQILDLAGWWKREGLQHLIETVQPNVHDDPDMYDRKGEEVFEAKHLAQVNEIMDRYFKELGLFFNVAPERIGDTSWENIAPIEHPEIDEEATSVKTDATPPAPRITTQPTIRYNPQQELIETGRALAEKFDQVKRRMGLEVGGSDRIREDERGEVNQFKTLARIRREVTDIYETFYRPDKELYENVSDGARRLYRRQQRILDKALEEDYQRAVIAHSRQFENLEDAGSESQFLKDLRARLEAREALHQEHLHNMADDERQLVDHLSTQLETVSADRDELEADLEAFSKAPSDGLSQRSVARARDRLIRLNRQANKLEEQLAHYVTEDGELTGDFPDEATKIDIKHRLQKILVGEQEYYAYWVPVAVGDSVELAFGEYKAGSDDDRAWLNNYLTEYVDGKHTLAQAEDVVATILSRRLGVDEMTARQTDSFKSLSQNLAQLQIVVRHNRTEPPEVDVENAA